MEESARTEIQRKMYLYSKTPSGLVPQGIIRPLARGGDFIRRADSTWRLIAGMAEDFSASGWVCVRAVQQITAPAAVLEKAQAFDAAQTEAEVQP